MDNFLIYICINFVKYFQSVKEEIRGMNKSRIKWWPQYLAAITGN